MRPKIAIFVVGFAICCGGAALARCPTSADLDGAGVRFITANGDIETHRRAPNGTILMTIEGTSFNGRNVLVHGIYPIQLAGVENGAILHETVWRFSYDIPIAELPQPVPNSEWSGTMGILFDGTLETEAIEQSSGAMRDIVIGDCTFTAIPLVLAFDGEDYDHTEEVVYLPDIGTALLTAYEDGEGRETYDYTLVEPVQR